MRAILIEILQAWAAVPWSMRLAVVLAVVTLTAALIFSPQRQRRWVVLGVVGLFTLWVAIRIWRLWNLQIALAMIVLTWMLLSKRFMASPGAWLLRTMGWVLIVDATLMVPLRVLSWADSIVQLDKIPVTDPASSLMVLTAIMLIRLLSAIDDFVFPLAFAMLARTLRTLHGYEKLNSTLIFLVCYYIIATLVGGMAIESMEWFVTPDDAITDVMRNMFLNQIIQRGVVQMPLGVGLLLAGIGLLRLNLELAGMRTLLGIALVTWGIGWASVVFAQIAVAGQIASFVLLGVLFWRSQSVKEEMRQEVAIGVRS